MVSLPSTSVPAPKGECAHCTKVTTCYHRRMRSTRNIIGLSAAAVAVVLLTVSITQRNAGTPSFSALTAATTRGVRAGSTRVPTRKVTKPSAGAPSSSATTNAWLSIATYGFKISYPKAWQVKKDPLDEGAMNVYLSSEAEKFIMTVTLASNAAMQSVKLDDVVKATLAAMPSALQFTVVKTENGTLVGVPTKVLTVTQKADDGTLLKGQQVFLIKGKTLCVFFFTNTPEKYAQALQLFSGILKTVTLR